MSHLLDGLNPEQARAVDHKEGPLLILAGAGSGKTRVLTRRVARLIETGVRPWNIFAVTFTNKAAGEMKERVSQLVGPHAHDVWVSTFHSSCVRILRREIEPLGWSRSFVIWDDDDQTRVIKLLLHERRIDPKRHPPGFYRGLIDRAKNALKGPDDIDPGPHQAPDIFRAYEERLKGANALDFNDLINKVVLLWDTRPEVLAEWQRRFQYVMVDEYQDTNAAQYKLLRLLGAQHRNVAVVGDDDQSIYSFRGADIRNILAFEEDFPGATVVRLEENYRSTANILGAASSLVSNNQLRKEKTLRTVAPPGDFLTLQTFPDERSEADAVVDEIRRGLRTRKPADYAIIYRTNAQSRPFERALTDASIPYVLVGGRKFYERREIRDLLGYLRLLLNPSDDMSFLRIVNVPTRGIGEKALEALQAEASSAGIPLIEAARRRAGLGGRSGSAYQGFLNLIDGFAGDATWMAPGELVLHIAESTGYLPELRREGGDEAAGRIENIEALASAVADAEVEDDASPIDRLIAFMDRASLAGQADELPDEGTGAVTLLTAHLAKGLEYPVVFLVGMCEGCFPHSRAERESEVEEERRLAYVAITRARERLHISVPRGRRAASGGWFDSFPSRFLEEIPAELFGRKARTREAPAWLQAGLRRPALASVPRPPSEPARPTNVVPFPRALHAVPPPPLREIPSPTRRMTPESLDYFKVGTEVVHPILGLGTVQKREGLPSNPRLTIHFRNHGPRTVFAVSARMEIVLP